MHQISHEISLNHNDEYAAIFGAQTFQNRERLSIKPRNGDGS